MHKPAPQSGSGKRESEPRPPSVLSITNSPASGMRASPAQANGDAMSATTEKPHFRQPGVGRFWIKCRFSFSVHPLLLRMAPMAAKHQAILTLFNPKCNAEGFAAAPPEARSRQRKGPPCGDPFNHHNASRSHAAFRRHDAKCGSATCSTLPP